MLRGVGCQTKIVCWKIVWNIVHSQNVKQGLNTLPLLPTVQHHKGESANYASWANPLPPVFENKVLMDHSSTH